MAKINTVVDSQTNNVTRKDTDFKGCGVVGTSEGAGSDFPSVKELRSSQEAGNKGIGLNEKSYNEDCADFGQNYAAPSDVDDEPTPSEDVEPRAWMP
jgi:hypothetical protein